MMEEDSLSRILYVDLSRRRFWVKERPELFEKWLGGAGVAIQLLKEECPKDADPFGPENPVIFAVGPLNGLFPIASKTAAMFKSPLTGNLGESYAGGRSSIALRMAGYGALVIKGSSETPVYLAVHEEDVHFREASVLWGMRSSYTVGRVIRGREPAAGVRTIMRIGRAGEKLVSYACLVTETYRHFGRLGLGAVFGSKKLKALTISGKRSFKFKKPRQYREVYDKIFEQLVTSPAMKKYHELGTAMNIGPLNEMKALPTKNLSSASFEKAEDISGESFAEKYLGRRVACAHCPVSCVHIAALREPYETEPYFYKTKMISYDYELIYALGSMLEIPSPPEVLKLIDEVETFGLDAMSTGVALAWATEMQERGLITETELSGLRLRWGDAEAYTKAIQMLVEQPNDFFRALARGVDYASLKYGGSEYALAFGGNEMPGYHTGPAAHVGYLVGARHSHLDGSGYSIDQKWSAAGRQPTAEDVAAALISEEIWRQILSSLVICYFGRGVYTQEIVVEALNVAGYPVSYQELMKLGAEILKAKYEFKFSQGFSFEGLKVPKRVLETPTPLGFISEDFIRESVNLYRRKLESL
ncbi:aldehyde ferredoxin oxidoreductase family protein [Candidatus Hecatella orcuttiae]|jgi:aldehyde:ferredoxin oxidoreductase|uniref:aldehyde ferredoxin oxidoreductase family protein n=1 Tax=Candidatus Hecatella orcuttiae TaxID=1935119 RepID=UPI002867BFC3|nr:aldehyde ferredoxin oxidoreductase family protein [Candidatus Hecatella orcuttiae]